MSDLALLSCLLSLPTFIGPNSQRAGYQAEPDTREHRVGVEPTLPHYECGVLAAGRPVLGGAVSDQQSARGENPSPESD